MKYSIAASEQKLVTTGVDSSKSGVMEFGIALDGDSIEVQDFKLRSDPINFSAIGKLAGFKSQDPRVSFAIQTGEFKIEQTRQYLPFIFFPESVHKELNRRFNNGTLKIKSLEFDGSLAKLLNLNSKKNKDFLRRSLWKNK